MNFIIVVTDKKDAEPVATICADYREADVVARHRASAKPGDITYVVPAHCDWSVQVRHTTVPEDVDGSWEDW